MKKFLLVLFFLISNYFAFTQIRTLDGGFNGLNQMQLDSLSNDEINVKVEGKTKFTDYKIISHDFDSTYIDTTLTIKKEYKFNFRRKDNFELLSFHNQGQTFNNLGYDFSHQDLFPDIGFKAKQFNYLKFDQVKYYQVPTPTTEIMYRTGQEQGQVLDALFTVNFNKRLNFSIAYKGLRSLGHYRNSLSSSGNFRTTLSYQTPQKQYAIRTHFAKQDFSNQESGGLTPEMLLNFENDDPNFTDRGRLDTNLNNTNNVLEGSRFYIDQNYKLFSSKDTLGVKDFSNLKIGHELRYEEKKYSFNQSNNTSEFFGATDFDFTNISEQTFTTFWNNQAYLEFNSKYILGRFKAKVNYTSAKYSFVPEYNINTLVSKSSLKGKAISVGGQWKARLGKINLNTNITIVPGQGHLAGNYVNIDALYKKDSLFTVKARLSQVSKAPNFSSQLFQSAYTTYNWTNDFKNVDSQNLNVSFLSKWGSAVFNVSNINDYVYFDHTSLPKQYNNSLQYFKLKIMKEFSYGKFALDNTILYQNVTKGSHVLRVPQFVTRNTLYYKDHWFKGNPLLVNIGVTFKYFTKYAMNAYNPLLAEFYLQDQTKIGYPTLDFFFNGRVRRTRIFFKLDNVSSFFLKKNYFSAPNYPYRDFSIRFGLVWNWFI